MYYSQEGLQVLLSLFWFKLSCPLCGPCHVLPCPAVGLILSLWSFLCSCLGFECRVCCQCLSLLYSHISQWLSILSLYRVSIYCIETSRLGNIVLDVFPPLETPSNHCQALFHNMYCGMWAEALWKHKLSPVTLLHLFQLP